MSATDESSSGGTIVAGLVMVVLAGCFNGSWNVPFSPTHGVAVKRVTTTTTNGNGETTTSTTSSNDNNNNRTDDRDLTYHLAWILFQVYAALINIPICIAWAGGLERVNYIVKESSAVDVIVVCIISMLWGIGSVGFGLACQVAGVGLGTNLCMGVIMVLGTFLPLCMDGAIGTPAGGVVVAGLVICCAGLFCSVQSLQLRDRHERAQRIHRRTMYNTTVSLRQLEESVPMTAAAKRDASTDEDSPSPPDDSSALGAETVPTEPTPVPDVEKNEDGDDSDGPSTMYKVAVCFLAGIFASQLQFAFVFGESLVDLAASDDGPGTTPPSGTGAIIWLFAISLGTPASIVYGWYNKSPEISLRRLYQCPWYRHVLIVLTTAIPWVAHIHLYGYANTLLPSKLGASVAWPVLMMTTVVAGMVWSIALGEWALAADAAKSKLYQGLILVSSGVVVIMVSVAI